MKNLFTFFLVVIISLSTKAQEQKVEIVPDSLFRPVVTSTTHVISLCGSSPSKEMMLKVSCDYFLPIKTYKICNDNWNIPQDIYNDIQAKAPNVRITTSADFNAIPRISMRGDDNTIVIVDGVRFDASILNMLNPADIQSITVAPSIAASNYLRNN